MEILAALGGAVIGAISSFALTQYFTSKSEQKKAFAALVTELRLNLVMAEKISQQNNSIDFQAKDGSEWAWCQVIPLSDSAWQAFVRQGNLSILSTHWGEQVSEVYSLVRSSNFQAVKIQMGKYHPREGLEYTIRIIETIDAIKRAMHSVQ